jgi:hypothetical protein
MPADRLVAAARYIDQQSAAMMLQGLTVQYLIRQIHGNIPSMAVHNRGGCPKPL